MYVVHIWDLHSQSLQSILGAYSNDNSLKPQQTFLQDVSQILTVNSLQVNWQRDLILDIHGKDTFTSIGPLGFCIGTYKGNRIMNSTSVVLIVISSYFDL